MTRASRRRRRVVVATAADLVETVAFVEAVGGLVGSAHFEEAFASLVAGRLAHQVFEQAQTEATPLAFGLHRDIQQVRLVEDDLMTPWPTCWLPSNISQQW